jgi:hypothetical protein
MKLKVNSITNELPQDPNFILEPENLEVEVDTLIKMSVKVPAAVEGVPGTKSFYMPTGYFTDPSDTNSWVSYTPSHFKFLAVILPIASRYNVGISGPSSIDKISSVKISSTNAVSPKIPLDSPLIIMEQGEGIKFSDFFSTEIPYKLDLFNAIGADNEIEIVIGLNQEQ